MTCVTIDTSGHVCPIPVLKLHRTIKSLKEGDVVTMIATDFGAKKDVVHFCQQNACILDSMVEKDGVLTFRIIKKN